jgi:hypothetical protein
MGGSKKSAAAVAVSAKQPQPQQAKKQQPAQPQPQMNGNSDDDSDAEQVAAAQSDDEDASPAPVADKKKKKKKKKKAAAPVQAVDSDASESDAEDQVSPVVAAAAPSKRSASSGKLASSKSPPSTYKGNYPPSRFGRTPHPQVPFWIALSTYFGYGLLIAVGHVRDFFNRWGLFRTVSDTFSPRADRTNQRSGGILIVTLNHLTSSSRRSMFDASLLHVCSICRRSLLRRATRHCRRRRPW